MYVVFLNLAEDSKREDICCILRQVYSFLSVTQSYLQQKRLSFPAYPEEISHECTEKYLPSYSILTPQHIEIQIVF